VGYGTALSSRLKAKMTGPRGPVRVKDREKGKSRGQNERVETQDMRKTEVFPFQVKGIGKSISVLESSLCSGSGCDLDTSVA
jgi:hypothetical protein